VGYQADKSNFGSIQFFQSGFFFSKLLRLRFDGLQSFGFERQSSSLQPLVDNQCQIIGRKRLGQEVVGSAFDGGHSQFDCSIAGDDDAYDVGVVLVDQRNKLDTADARHHYVDKRQLELSRTYLGYPLLSILGCFDKKALRRQCPFTAFANAGFIVNDQNIGFSHIESMKI
jgi:hypothetical protein